MLQRVVLPVLVLVLLVLVLADRVVRARRPADREASVAARSAAGPGGAAGSRAHRSSQGARPGEPPGESPLERIARLASRRRLADAGPSTYLDSMLATTDSVVRRWPDARRRLRVAIVEGGAVGWSARAEEPLREAFRTWEGLGLGLGFDFVADTAGADVSVRWINRFDFDRVGQTDLAWDPHGQVRRAAITLALRNNLDQPLDDRALRAVALHETGHALGLPHSSDSGDVMFPATRTDTLTPRDRRTAQLLYGLAPGSVKDLPARP